MKKKMRSTGSERFGQMAAAMKKANVVSAPRPKHPKGDLLKPPARCWQCKKSLPDEKPLFCNIECGYFWAVTQASVLAALKARAS